MGHAKLSPSAAGRWVCCPGSVTMEERFPDLNEGDDGEEGTASHWVASEVLVGRGASPFTGRTAPNGVIITDEMVDHAKEYVHAVYEAMPLAGCRNVEQVVAVPRVHAECWGTPDCWFFDSGKAELHIWDYKYGWGLVEAFENWQLICYAAGALDLVTGNIPVSLFDQNVTVVLHIVQPRPYHPEGSHRTWRIPASDLRGYINRLEGSAAEALGNNPKCVSGRHCRYCSARHACPSAHRAAMAAIDYTLAATPQGLDPAGLALELTILRRAEEAITYRLSGIESAAIESFRQGGAIPGFGVEYGKGRPSWSKPAGEIFALGDMMEIDLRAPQKPVTPAQARKAGLPSELIDAYSAAGQTGMKLVRQDKTLASRVFGGGS